MEIYRHTTYKSIPHGLLQKLLRTLGYHIPGLRGILGIKSSQGQLRTESLGQKTYPLAIAAFIRPSLGFPVKVPGRHHTHLEKIYVVVFPILNLLECLDTEVVLIGVSPVGYISYLKRSTQLDTIGIMASHILQDNLPCEIHLRQIRYDGHSIYEVLRDFSIFQKYLYSHLLKLLLMS